MAGYFSADKIITMFIAIALDSCAPATGATPDADSVSFSATREARWVECHELDKSALAGRKDFSPGDIITGPASITPDPYMHIIYLAPALKLDMLASGGLIVPEGHSVEIPRELNVGKGNIWSPDGEVVFYTSDKLMYADMKCWSIARSP